MKSDPFHYERTELVEHFLSMFESGLSSSKTLFERRRMGKTEFIVRDLAPAATTKGYKVVYCNFWGNENNPTLMLINSVQNALKSTGLKESFKALGKKNIKVLEVSMSAVGLKTGVKAELSNETPTPDQLNYLFNLIEELASNNKKVMFLLDEVQHLATRKEFEPLISSLRTVFDNNKDKIKVIYTGSSREGLQRLFKRKKSPLFKASSQIDLPKLGREFVQFEMKAYENATGRKFSDAVAWHSFKRLHYTPRDFRDLLEASMNEIIEPLQFKKFADAFCKDKEGDSEYEALWKKLSHIDRIILEIVHKEEGEGLYSESTKEYLMNKLCVQSLANHTIQNAIIKLRNKAIIVQLERSDLEFEDAYFRAWCEANVFD